MESSEFVRGFLDAALFSSTDDDGEPLDRAYGIGGIDYKTWEWLEADCESFMAANATELDGFDSYTAGADYWYTRNGHGCGYWDGGYPEDIGAALTLASERAGGIDLYVGDDGTIYAAQGPL